jgi:hypothetical protein
MLRTIPRRCSHHTVRIYPDPHRTARGVYIMPCVRWQEASKGNSNAKVSPGAKGPEFIDPPVHPCNR